MKKNITINMLGVLYNIDEDAYELLNQYLDGMKDYFTRHGDDGEIAQDIEYRIAELMNEMKAGGKNVITIEDVTHICQQVGKPEEIDTEEDEASTSTSPTKSESSEESGNAEDQEKSEKPEKPKTPNTKRKLYRNTDDKMLGGVLSGLAQFAGNGDALPWRIAFVLLVIIGVPFVSSQFLILAYLLAWMIMPGLHTPEDRLRMRGEKVCAENVQNELLTPAQQTTAMNDTANGCLTAIVWIFKIALFLFLGALGLTLLLTLLAAITVPLIGLIPCTGVLAAIGSWLPSPLLSYTLIICVVLVFAIPLVALLHAIFAKRPSTWTTRIIALLVWLAALIAICYSVNEMHKTHLGDHDFNIALPGINIYLHQKVLGVDIDEGIPDLPDTTVIDTVTAVHPDGSEEIFPE